MYSRESLTTYRSTVIVVLLFLGIANGTLLIGLAQDRKAPTLQERPSKTSLADLEQRLTGRLKKGEKTPPQGICDGTIYWNNFFTPFAVGLNEDWVVQLEVLPRKLVLKNNSVINLSEKAEVDPSQAKNAQLYFAQSVHVDDDTAREGQARRRMRSTGLTTGFDPFKAINLAMELNVDRHLMIHIEVWRDYPGMMWGLLKDLADKDLNEANRHPSILMAERVPDNRSFAKIGDQYGPCYKLFLRANGFSYRQKMIGVRHGRDILIVRGWYQTTSHERYIDEAAANGIFLADPGPDRHDSLPRNEEAAIAFFKSGGAFVGMNDQRQATSLNLSGVLPASSELRALSHMSSLRRLTVVGAPMTDADMQALREMEHLSYLHLGYAPITDVGLHGISDLTQLRNLSLIGCTSVTDQGMQALRGLTQLRQLDLSETSVGDHGLSTLTTLTSLTSLNVSDSKVSADGRIGFFKSIPGLAKTLPKVAESQIQVFNGHESAIEGVAISGDGRLAASAGRDSTVRVWHLKRGQVAHVLKEPDRDKPSIWRFNDVAFSPDGRFVAACTELNSLYVWDVATGKLVKEHFVYTGSASSVGMKQLAFSNDGSRIAIGMQSGTLYVWDWQKNEDAVRDDNSTRIGRHGREIEGVAFSRDGKRVVTSSVDQSIAVWDIDAKTLVWRDEQEWSIWDAAWSRDGRKIAAISTDGKVFVWDAQTGDLQKTLSLGYRSASLAMAPDATLCAVESDNNIEIVSLTTGQTQQILTGHTSIVTDISFSDDGKFLVSGDLDGKVRYWRIDASLAAKTEVSSRLKLHRQQSPKFQSPSAPSLHGFRTVRGYVTQGESTLRTFVGLEITNVKEDQFTGVLRYKGGSIDVRLKVSGTSDGEKLTFTTVAFNGRKNPNFHLGAKYTGTIEGNVVRGTWSLPRKGWSGNFEMTKSDE